MLVTIPNITADTLIAATTLASARLIAVVHSALATGVASQITIYRAGAATGGTEAWSVNLPAGGSQPFEILNGGSGAVIESGVGIFIGATDWTGRRVSVAVERSAL